MTIVITFVIKFVSAKISDRVELLNNRATTDPDHFGFCGSFWASITYCSETGIHASAGEGEVPGRGSEPLYTQTKSCDHENMRALENQSKGRMTVRKRYPILQYMGPQV